VKSSREAPPRTDEMYSVILSAAKDLIERSDTYRAAGARSFAALRTTGDEAALSFKKFDAFSCHFVTRAELGAWNQKAHKFSRRQKIRILVPPQAARLLAAEAR